MSFANGNIYFACKLQKLQITMIFNMGFLIMCCFGKLAARKNKRILLSLNFKFRQQYPFIFVAQLKHFLHSTIYPMFENQGICNFLLVSAKYILPLVKRHASSKAILY